MPNDQLNPGIAAGLPHATQVTAAILPNQTQYASPSSEELVSALDHQLGGQWKFVATGYGSGWGTDTTGAIENYGNLNVILGQHTKIVLKYAQFAKGYVRVVDQNGTWWWFKPLAFTSSAQRPNYGATINLLGEPEGMGLTFPNTGIISHAVVSSKQATPAMAVVHPTPASLYAGTNNANLYAAALSKQLGGVWTLNPVSAGSNYPAWDTPTSDAASVKYAKQGTLSVMGASPGSSESRAIYITWTGGPLANKAVVSDPVSQYFFSRSSVTSRQSLGEPMWTVVDKAPVLLQKFGLGREPVWSENDACWFAFDGNSYLRHPGIAAPYQGLGDIANNPALDATVTALAQALQGGATTGTMNGIASAFQSAYNAAGGSPQIGVDDYYGPCTQAALQAYYNAQGAGTAPTSAFGGTCSNGSYTPPVSGGGATTDQGPPVPGGGGGGGAASPYTTPILIGAGVVAAGLVGYALWHRHGKRRVYRVVGSSSLRRR